MAAKSTRRNAPAVTRIDVTHLLASAKPATCGEAHKALVAAFGSKAADAYAAEGCKRLPRHEVTAEKGHKADKPRGLMTAAQRIASAKAAKVRHEAAKAATNATKAVSAKPQYRTFDGVRFLVTKGANGSLHLTPAPRSTKAEPVVTEVPMAESPRQVAAPAKVTRTSRPKADPTAAKAVSRVTRAPKAEPVVATA